MTGAPRWWRLAEAQCTRLTTPDDVDASDRELEALFLTSRTGVWMHSLLRRLDAAWQDSVTRVVVRWIRRS